jgi:hypothetical protein
MDQFYPDDSLIPLLQRLLVGGVKINMCTLALPWTESTTAAALFAASVASPTTVAAADFTLTGVVGHTGSVTAAPVLVTNGSGGSQTVTGYFYADAGNSLLLGAVQFPSSQVVPNGDSITVFPSFSLASLFTS